MIFSNRQAAKEIHPMKVILSFLPWHSKSTLSASQFGLCDQARLLGALAVKSFPQGPDQTQPD